MPREPFSGRVNHGENPVTTLCLIIRGGRQGGERIYFIFSCPAGWSWLLTNVSLCGNRKNQRPGCKQRGTKGEEVALCVIKHSGN